MMEEALRQNVKKIHIILSSKMDGKKNPLHPEDKRYLLESYGIPRAKTGLVLRLPHQAEPIENLAVNIMLTHEYSQHFRNDILGTVQELLLGRNRGEKVIFMTGEKGFPVDKGTEVILLDRTKNPISGTMVREAAFESYEAFAAFYPGLPENDLKWMYEDILDLDLPLPVEEEEVPPQRYALRSHGPIH
jgi:glutathionyl-hydroquinone reductase